MAVGTIARYIYLVLAYNDKILSIFFSLFLSLALSREVTIEKEASQSGIRASENEPADTLVDLFFFSFFLFFVSTYRVHRLFIKYKK